MAKARRLGTVILVAAVLLVGSVGALTAEIRSGGESSESVLALAAILAAQLAGVLAPPPEANAEAVSR